MRQSYVETRKFKSTECYESKSIYYPVNEAEAVFGKVVEKYKALNERILICLRDSEHILIKSELIL